MVDRGRSPIRTAKSPASTRGGEAEPLQSSRLLAGDTSELTRAELNALLAQEAQEEVELGSSTVRLEADELDTLLEKARQKLPPPRAQQTTQPYDPITAFALLDKDHRDSTPTAPGLSAAPEPEEAAAERGEEPVIDVDEGEAIESSAAIAPPAPARGAPEDPAPPIASSPLPLVPAAPTPHASLASAEGNGLDDARAHARRLRTRILLAVAGALTLAALLYLALAEAAPATSPAPPVEPASGETRPSVPAR